MKLLRIGFTGPQEGMTNAQVIAVHMLLGDLKTAGAMYANHGLCVGSDVQFHEMARALGYTIVGWPGVTNTGQVYQRASVICDDIMPVKFFLDRNRDIVMASSVLLATPSRKREEVRSGTWATIRHARKVKLPLCLIWPDGTGTVEHIPGVTTVDAYRERLVQHG